MLRVRFAARGDEECYQEPETVEGFSSWLIRVRAKRSDASDGRALGEERDDEITEAVRVTERHEAGVEVCGSYQAHTAGF